MSNHQFKPWRVPKFVDCVQLFAYELFLEKLTSRAKNFPFLPNVDLHEEGYDQTPHIINATIYYTPTPRCLNFSWNGLSITLQDKGRKMEFIIKQAWFHYNYDHILQ